MEVLYAAIDDVAGNDVEKCCPEDIGWWSDVNGEGADVGDIVGCGEIVGLWDMVPKLIESVFELLLDDDMSWTSCIEGSICGDFTVKVG